MTDLQQSYSCCRAIARKRARNFYHAFAILPRAKRDAMCAVYAFMRHCDDAADDPHPEQDRSALLSAWRDLLEAACRGDCQGSTILPAFRDTLLKFGIPKQYFHDLIDGAASDMSVTNYPSFDQLYEYCYKVASVVGLVCIHIFGFDAPEARKHAEYCGIAFQLTNILRDLKEDVDMGRVYIPQEDLWAFNYGADELARGVRNESFRRLMRFEVARARDYYRAALPLIEMVSPSARPGLRAMIGVYSALLDKIERSDYDVFSRRIALSSARKIGIAARALLIPGASGGARFPAAWQS